MSRPTQTPASEVPEPHRCQVALIQCAPVAFDREASIDIVAERCASAKQLGAQVVVFPEAFISGYPKGSDFGVKVGSRTPEGRDLYRRYWEAALQLPSPAATRLGAIAREHQIYLVVGVIEAEGGTLYCSVLYYGPDGQLRGKHRKLVPTAAERFIWGSGDGSTLKVVPTQFGPCKLQAQLRSTRPSRKETSHRHRARTPAGSILLG